MPEPFAPPLPPGRYVELPRRGRTWVHEARGPHGASTLVLLHGLSATAALNWFTAFAALSRRFHVVALDQRGHGRGIRSSRPFRLEDCADDAVALADELGINRFIPVGYSMGGPVAQLVWRRHPDRTEGIVLCATSRNFRGGGEERLLFTALPEGFLGYSLGDDLLSGMGIAIAYGVALSIPVIGGPLALLIWCANWRWATGPMDRLLYIETLGFGLLLWFGVYCSRSLPKKVAPEGYSPNADRLQNPSTAQSHLFH